MQRFPVDERVRRRTEAHERVGQERLGREESDCLKSLGADFLLAFAAGSHLDGFLSLGAKQPLEAGDIRLLRAIAAQAAEPDAAREVQQRLFPSQHPRVPGLEYYSDWRPASTYGGDYLDFFEMPEGNLGLAMGDVAGPSVAAAIVASSLHSMTHGPRPSAPPSLSGLVGAMDELCCQVCPENSYATLFAARYEPARGLLHYVNAGHEPPVLLRKSATGYRTIALESSGPMIGMLRKSSHRERVVSLGPGDLLMVYTDGLCGVLNSRGEEWGYQRLIETVRSASYRNARDIVERVLDSAEAFAGGCPQYDDMTLWLGRVEDSYSNSLTLTESVPLEAAA